MSTADTPELHPIAHDTFVAYLQAVAQAVREDAWLPDYVVGIGRGGLVPAVYLSHALDVPMLSIDHSSQVPGFADDLLGKVAAKTVEGTHVLFVDDINDSGGTIAAIDGRLAAAGCARDKVRFAVLLNNSRSTMRVAYRAETIDRAQDKRWFVFPWEAVAPEAAIRAEAVSVPERLA